MFVANRRDLVTLVELITAEYDSAFRLAFALLHDVNAAEDAVQEAAFKAWRKIGQLREGSPFKPWFLGIVANECRSATRRRWWSVVRVPEVRRLRVEEPPDAVDSLELRAALKRLSYDERVILILRFYVDLSYEEIGLYLGVSVKAARTRTERALRRLKPMLRMQEVIA
jgi:RNA polymerase sigma-70 factor (ECF subfamily)